MNLVNFAFAQGISSPLDLTGFIQEYCRTGVNLNFCLQGIYNLLVAIAVVVAFFMFLFGAFENLLSVIPDVKMQGKNRMKNAIIGLGIIFVSGVLLYWINPSIFNARLIMYQVVFSVPEIEIQKINIGTESSGLEEPNAGANVSTSGFQWGKPLIKQNDPLWKDFPYRHPTCGRPWQTIGSSGCGIASLSMAIAYYNNYDKSQYKNLITTLAQDAIQKGYRTCDSGTSHALYTDNDYLRNWNIKGTYIGTDIDKAISAVKNGKIVIAAMKGPSIFTRRGHYIVVVGFDNGNFLINDPGPKDIDQASLNTFKEAVKAMWIIDKI
jgi:hypothetical protein